MNLHLMVDFGSTYTKLTAVDLDICDIVATSKAITTIETDIAEGYHNALKGIYEKLGTDIKFNEVVACSSAAGGLKMAAIGLVQELTVEAARRVCLGAGAKVSMVFSHEMTKSEAEKIRDGAIDIVLLAGGTDGGNRECVIHNAKKLVEAGISVPIIFAGNKSCQDEIEEIFKAGGANYFICDNVMPRLNILNLEGPRNQIKEVFVKNIIEAKGIKKIEAEIDKVILPTPNSVLMACELLSKGYGKEEGLGEIMLVDIGGATTDVYSMSAGTPKKPDVIVKGLQEPYAKRTVEGDLGMRYSIFGIVEAMTVKQKQLLEDEGIDIEEEARKRRENIEMVPSDEFEYKVEGIFGKTCSDVSMSRHVGVAEHVHTSMGVMTYQTGKDLTGVHTIIGTGGVVVHSKNPVPFMEGMCANIEKLNELRPRQATYMVDKDYILSAMGLLSIKHPDIALKIMKKRIVKI